MEISTKTVHYFNSIKRHRVHHRAPRDIKKYIEMYYADRGETVKFKLDRRRDAPEQGNGYDCGVFVCQYAERVARRSPLNFRQKDLDRVGAREMIINELLEGRINPTWQMVNSDRVEETEWICKEVKKKVTRSRHGAEKKCQKKLKDRTPTSKKGSNRNERRKESSEEATEGEEERLALV